MRAEVEASKRGGPARRRREPTVAEFAEQHLRDGVRHSPGTARDRETTLRLHVLPAFGRMKVTAVHASDVRRWQNALVAGSLAPSTQSKVESAARWLFQAIADDDWAPSPFTRVKRVKVGAEDMVRRNEFVPSMAQARELIDALAVRRPLVAAVVTFMIGTGARLGEIVGLHPDDVVDGFWHIDHQLQRRQEGFYLGPPKSETGVRSVPLPAFARKALAEQMLRQGGPARLRMPWVEVAGPSEWSTPCWRSGRSTQRPGSTSR